MLYQAHLKSQTQLASVLQRSFIIHSGAYPCLNRHFIIIGQLGGIPKIGPVQQIGNTELILTRQFLTQLM